MCPLFFSWHFFARRRPVPTTSARAPLCSTAATNLCPRPLLVSSSVLASARALLCSMATVVPTSSDRVLYVGLCSHPPLLDSDGGMQANVLCITVAYARRHFALPAALVCTSVSLHTGALARWQLVLAVVLPCLRSLHTLLYSLATLVCRRCLCMSASFARWRPMPAVVLSRR